MAKKKKSIEPEKVEPLYIDGKNYCPNCKTRDFELLDYDSGSKPGLYKFKEYCKTCNVVWEIEETLK